MEEDGNSCCSEKTFFLSLHENVEVSSNKAVSTGSEVKLVWYR